MIFRLLLLVALLGLSACNGSDSKSPQTDADTSDSTFADLATAKGELVKVNAAVSAAEQKRVQLEAERVAAQKALDDLKAARASEIAAAQKALGDLAVELEIKTADLLTAQQKLDDLTRKDSANPGSIKEAEAKLKKAEDDLAILNGDANKPGSIAEARKILDDLTRTDKDNPGEIAVAQKLLADINAKIAALGKASKLVVDGKPLDAANLLKDAGLTQEAIDLLKNAALFKEAAVMLTADGKLQEGVKLLMDTGLHKEAADMLAKAGKPKEGAELLKTAGLKQEAADMLKSAGLDEDAYKLFAPEDYKLDDKTKYNAADIGQLPKAVDEAPAVKRHKMTFADSSKTPFWYTASAGHLTAYDNNLTMKGAKASIFYTAYTRDDLPKENRPVTFFFNGGPGEASIWLHMGGFAPKYVQTNEPIVPAGAETKTPRYKLLDDEETLLDKSDLVFVDPVGTGYSQAIKPHTNKSFWGTDVDSKILRDFIVRYTNVNNRQSSPKYLYGESYGGFRAPIVAKLLTDAGTSVYEADTSGRKTVVLTGFVLHSPILDYRTNCSASTAGYCAGLLPTYAMTADFFRPVNKRQTLPIADYAQSLRNFVRDTHKPNVDTYLRSSKDWTAYKATAPGLAYLSSLQTYADVPVTKWANNPNMKPDDIMGVLKPGYTYNVYDARMTISNRSFISPTTGEPPYHFSYIEDDGIKELFKDFRPDFLNYSNTSYYTASASVTSVGWVGSWDWGAGRDGNPSKVQTHALDDLTRALTNNPELKVLSVHGYYDTVTPFYQTELDLAGIDLSERIQVKSFEAGHMIYYSNAARAPLRDELVKVL
ncbi:S10 family serine carboxypeptidase-like protein [Phyllobacterium zundukense]|uniref:Peptidase S10 n=1 Tax=Phyllobacterium zundukense TaxID=1867719 RepID=A0A2N9VQA8_9HYPH|nr:hypothetical protein [Phyllobacterium zundukense]PIO41676.1 hypothetical protein B5P45_27385 [Phyllobacterium zundukense]